MFTSKIYKSSNYFLIRFVIIKLKIKKLKHTTSLIDKFITFLNILILFFSTIKFYIYQDNEFLNHVLKFAHIQL